MTTREEYERENDNSSTHTEAQQPTTQTTQLTSATLAIPLKYNRRTNLQHTNYMQSLHAHTSTLHTHTHTQ